MAWAEIETYRQLLQKYEKEREELVDEEQTYRAAVAKDAAEVDPAQLAKQYAELIEKRTELSSKLKTLEDLRTSAAEKRDAVGQALSI
jgi:uncharacterized coiled-coil DUF342 family protein